MNGHAFGARDLVAFICAISLASSLSTAWAESSSVAIEMRYGLPHLRIGILGCTSQPDIDMVLDTGASATMIPYDCLRELERDGAAIEVESRSVVLADGSEQRVAGYFINGLKLGECEIASVSVVCCKDPSLAFPPVLGMDILQRLPNLSLQLTREGGRLTFDCPSKPIDIDSCGATDGHAEPQDSARNFTLRRSPTDSGQPCPDG